MEKELQQDIIAPPYMQLSKRKTESAFGHLKGDDWRVWALGLSQLLLQKRLLGEKRENWMQFVKACQLLVRPSVWHDDLIEADRLLRSLGVGYGDIYGKPMLTPNMSCGKSRGLWLHICLVVIGFRAPLCFLKRRKTKKKGH